MSFVNDGSSGLKYFPQLPAFTTEEIMTSFHKAICNLQFQLINRSCWHPGYAVMVDLSHRQSNHDTLSMVA